jgi:hypothetical protein
MLELLLDETEGVWPELLGQPSAKGTQNGNQA